MKVSKKTCWEGMQKSKLEAMVCLDHVEENNREIRRDGFEYMGENKHDDIWIEQEGTNICGGYHYA